MNKGNSGMKKSFSIAGLHIAAKLAFAIAAARLGTWTSLAEAAKDGPQFRYMRFPQKDVRINLTESRVAPYTLEDPLAFADGRKVETPEDWAARRRDHDAAASDPLRYAPANWRDGWAWRDYPCATEAEPAAMAALAVECVDGGLVEDFAFRGIEIDGGCYSPVLVRAGIRGPRATGAPRGRHNIMRRITFEDVRGYALSGVPSIVTGVPGFHIKDVAFRNVHLTGRGVGNHAALNELSVPEYEDHYPMGGMFLQAMPAYGLYARHVDGLVLENADFATDTRKDVVLEDATCTSKDITALAKI